MKCKQQFLLAFKKEHLQYGCQPLFQPIITCTLFDKYHWKHAKKQKERNPIIMGRTLLKKL
jgi:hypothetical protein